MTIVIFSWILFLIIFCIYNDLFSSSIFHKNYDVFYMIQQQQQQQQREQGEKGDKGVKGEKGDKATNTEKETKTVQQYLRILLL